MQKRFKLGQLVKVSKSNDNENYDSFRGETLEIIHVATNTNEHPGFDDSANCALYDLKTTNGEEINCSLYDYELDRA